jgi:hypothetical protein
VRVRRLSPVIKLTSEPSLKAACNVFYFESRGFLLGLGEVLEACGW